MDRIWQWAWDRYRAKYLWAMCAIAFPVVLPIYLLASFLVVAFEKSGHYVEAVVATVAAVLVMCYTFFPADRRGFRLVEQWAAGHEVDRTKALESTYTYARAAVARCLAVHTVGGAALSAVVGAIAGATGSRLVQWAIIGASVGGICQGLTGSRSFVEGALRPARVALAGDTSIGDSLPR